MDLLTLLIVICGTGALGAVGAYFATGSWQRVMVIGVLAGLLLYSGIGAAYKGVPAGYLAFYLVFAAVFVVGFIFFCVVFTNLSRRVGRVLPSAFSSVADGTAWNALIWVYIGLNIVPLIYPEMRLQLLLAPPVPDLVAAFGIQFQAREIDMFLRLVEYARLLLGPFFYIALYRYRNRLWALVSVLACLLYVQYVQTASIGRGSIAVALAVVWLSLWMSKPNRRLLLVFVALVVTPSILMAAYAYGVVRIGGSLPDVTVQQATVEIFEQETSFPLTVGTPIIQGGRRVDLGEYAKWIVTLPIPKILTGEIDAARVNYEISEYVVGIRPGMVGWYVVLPGLVVESVYIYGPYFFWVHALFIAFFAAVLVRLGERSPEMVFLNANVVFLFVYILNRAGVGALLPTIVNEFMLFYVFVILNVFGIPAKVSLQRFDGHRRG